MSYLLMFIGYGWALFGVYNFSCIEQNTFIEFGTTLPFIINLYIFGPGLLLGALGNILHKINKKEEKEEKQGFL